MLADFQWPYGGEKVYLCSSFTHWNPLKMKRSLDGNGWKLTLPLEYGLYHYKFIVDNSWCYDVQDLHAPDEHGHINNIRLISKVPFCTLPKCIFTILDIVPPRELWEQIQPIRTKHLNNLRCGPHISILDPFLPLAHFPAISRALTEDLATFEPFTITFRKFSHFVQKSSCVVWLVPESDPPSALPDLLHRLLLRIPQCDDQLRKAPNKQFIPHVTVARVPGPQEAVEFITKLEQNWKPLTFLVQELYMMARTNFDPFELFEVLPLGPPRRPAHFGLPPAVGSREERFYRTLVVSGFPKGTAGEQLEVLFTQRGHWPSAVEVNLNPDGRARTTGVVEFATHDEAVAALDQMEFEGEYVGVYLRPLYKMMYLDVVNGLCSLNSLQIENI